MAKRLRVRFNVEIYDHLDEVMDFIQEKGKVTQKELMEEFNLTDWEAHDLLTVLWAKWMVYVKPYMIFRGKQRVPVSFWVPRPNGKPKRPKRAAEIDKKKAREKERRRSQRAAQDEVMVKVGGYD